MTVKPVKVSKLIEVERILDFEVFFKKVCTGEQTSISCFFIGSCWCADGKRG